jgi:hypothetical protein
MLLELSIVHSEAVNFTELRSIKILVAVVGVVGVGQRTLELLFVFVIKMHLASQAS